MNKKINGIKTEWCSGEFTCVINPYFLRYLYNGKKSNNWYKIHGGIMVRQCGKHKKKIWNWSD